MKSSQHCLFSLPHLTLASSLIALTLLLSTGGCRKRPESSALKTQGKENAEDEATQLLSNVVGLLTGRTDAGTYSTAVQQLNKFIERRPGDIADLAAEDRTRIAGILGAAGVSLAERKNFSNDDIEALRQVFFVRGLAKQWSDSSRSPVAQSQYLFDRVVSELALVPTGSAPLVPPQEALTRGFGDYQERIWIFLELLRQSDIHGAVVGVTTKTEANTIVPWLVAALIDGKAFLFDPVAGLPLKNPAGEIATLSDLAKDISLFQKQYGDASPGIVDPNQVDRFALLIGFDPFVFAPRMRFLQSKLLGDDRVNLVIDFEETIKRADSALADVPNHLGVQPWRLPDEVKRNFLAKKLKMDQTLENWIANQERDRGLALAGKVSDAIRGFVGNDLGGYAVVGYELILRRWKLPTTETRALINRVTESRLHFAGLAQRQANPTDPSFAIEWFERALKRSTTWQLANDDIIDIVRFGRQLAGHESYPRSPWHARLFELLSDESKELARKAAAADREASIAAPLVPEASATIDAAQPLTLAEIEKLIANINQTLERPDFVEPSAFDDFKKDATHPALAALANRDPKSLSPNELAWRNRMGFDRAFEESLLPADDPWLAGIIRNLAECYLANKEPAKARELLSAEYPTLVPAQRASLAALLRTLPPS